MTTEELNDLTARLNRIEQALDVFVQQRSVNEWYSTAEVAKLLGTRQNSRSANGAGLAVSALKRRSADVVFRANGSSLTKN